MLSFYDNFVLGVALTLPIGPITLEILRRGIVKNFFESIKTASGAFSAELVYFTIIYLGLISFSENYILNFALGLFGSFFLVYIGYENIKDFLKKSSTDHIPTIYKNSFLSGFFITLLNPLNFFMWAGIIGGFFAKGASLFVCSGVLLGIFLSLFIVATMSKLSRKVLKNNNIKYVSLVSGLFLIFYGFKLFIDIF